MFGGNLNRIHSDSSSATVRVLIKRCVETGDQNRLRSPSRSLEAHLFGHQKVQADHRSVSRKHGTVIFYIQSYVSSKLFGRCRPQCNASNAMAEHECISRDGWLGTSTLVLNRTSAKRFFDPSKRNAKVEVKEQPAVQFQQNFMFCRTTQMRQR